MPLRFEQTFYPIRSTEPSFNMTLSTASSAVALESTAVGRIWAGGSGRAIRIMESSGVEFYAQFGTSAVVAVSTGSMRLLGGVAETFHIEPGQTYIALMTDSTQVSNVNITLGHGR